MTIHYPQPHPLQGMQISHPHPLPPPPQERGQNGSIMDVQILAACVVSNEKVEHVWYQIHACKFKKI
jgi:hypothetical protein